MDNQRQLFIDAQNYYVGDGGRHQDRLRALELLRRVCYEFRRPIPAAARMLANCMETGEGTAVDLHEALHLYQIAGDSSAISRCNIKIRNPGSHGHSFVPDQRPNAALPPRHPPSGGSARIVGGGKVDSIPQPNSPVALPLHIERIVLQDAERNGYMCSISYASLCAPEHTIYNMLGRCDVVTIQNGAVTSCGHIFVRQSIEDWMQNSAQCPECRRSFVLSKSS
jgi:hypothetical protein